MFSTYLLVCVCACLLFHMHVLLPETIPSADRVTAQLLENHKRQAESLEKQKEIPANSTIKSD